MFVVSSLRILCRILDVSLINTQRVRRNGALLRRLTVQPGTRPPLEGRIRDSLRPREAEEPVPHAGAGAQLVHAVRQPRGLRGALRALPLPVEEVGEEREDVTSRRARAQLRSRSLPLAQGRTAVLLVEALPGVERCGHDGLLA